MSTRGERNFNPGNIRHVKGVTWVGQSPTQTDDSFVQFDTAEFGIRAITRIMRSYERQGIMNVAETIDRWAPPNENNSQAYVDAVCKECSVEADEPISIEAIMPLLIRGIIRHENGEVIYSDAQISAGIALA